MRVFFSFWQAEPAGLQEVVCFDTYLTEKFGADYIQENIVSNIESLMQYLRQGQQWSMLELSAAGDTSPARGAPAVPPVPANDQLTMCMKELKVRNRWKKKIGL